MATRNVVLHPCTRAGIHVDPFRRSHFQSTANNFASFLRSETPATTVVTTLETTPQRSNLPFLFSHRCCRPSKHSLHMPFARVAPPHTHTSPHAACTQRARETPPTSPYVGTRFSWLSHSPLPGCLRSGRRVIVVGLSRSAVGYSRVLCGLIPLCYLRVVTLVSAGPASLAALALILQPSTPYCLAAACLVASVGQRAPSSRALECLRVHGRYQGLRIARNLGDHVWCTAEPLCEVLLPGTTPDNSRRVCDSFCVPKAVGAGGGVGVGVCTEGCARAEALSHAGLPRSRSHLPSSLSRCTVSLPPW